LEKVKRKEILLGDKWVIGDIRQEGFIGPNAFGIATT
jgi:hypothetical protein